MNCKQIYYKSENQRILTNKSIYIISLILACFTLLIALIKGVNKEHLGIIFLPVTVCISAFFLYKNRSFIGFGFTFLFLMYLFRYTIVPAIAILGDYYIDVKETIYLPYFNSACLLMAYEIICVTLIALLLQRKSNKNLSKIFLLKNKPSICKFRKSFMRTKNNTLLKLVILFLFIFLIGCLLFFPQLLSIFKFIFGSDEYQLLKYNQYVAISSTVPSPIFYSFVFFVEVIRIVIPLYILVSINKKNMAMNLKIILSEIILAVFLLITTQVQITGIFVALVGNFYLIEKNIALKKYFIIIGTLVLTVSFFFLINKYSSANNLQLISRVIQNYFNGPSCIAAALGVDRSDGFQYFFIDALNANALISGLFNFHYSSYNLHLVYIQDLTGSSIFPFIAQSKFYFGYFLSPIMSIFVVAIITKMDFYNENNSNELMKVISMFIVFKLGICVSMYYVATVFSVFYDYIIPLFIIILLQKIFVFKDQRSCTNLGEKYVNNNCSRL